MKRIPLFLFLILSVINCFAQTQIDPTYQIQWNLLSGSGAPSMTCTQNGNYTVYPYGAEWGQPYLNTTNNDTYICGSAGWVLKGSGDSYLPLSGGTLTGPLNGTSASFSGTVAATTIVATQIVGQGTNTTIQAAITAAGTTGSVQIPATYAGTDTYTNPNGIRITDLRVFAGDNTILRMLTTLPLMTEAGYGDDKQARACAGAASCKVVYIGDSITQGNLAVANEDSWAWRTYTLLEEAVPGVTFTGIDLGISGESTNGFNDVTYTCETSGANTFYFAGYGNGYFTWPNQCSIGESWKQHVADQMPDIVFVAFGMNQGSGTEPAYSFTGGLQGVVTYLQGLPKPPTIVLVSTFTNGQYQTVVPNEQQGLLQVAQGTRELAKRDSLLLIDAGRLFTVERNGFDPARSPLNYETPQTTSFPAGWSTFAGGAGTIATNTITVPSGGGVYQRHRDGNDIVINATFASLTASSVPTIYYRMPHSDTTGASSYAVTATFSGSTWTVALASVNGALTSGACSGVSSTLQLLVRVIGSKNEAYCNGSNTPLFGNIGGGAFPGYPDYANPGGQGPNNAGYYAVGIGTTGGTIVESAFVGAAPTLTTNPVSEQSLIGANANPSDYANGDFLTNPFSLGGNAINHPSMVGHDVYYVAAALPVILKLQNDMSAVSGGSTTSLQTISNGGTPSYGTSQDILSELSGTAYEDLVGSSTSSYGTKIWRCLQALNTGTYETCMTLTGGNLTVRGNYTAGSGYGFVGTGTSTLGTLNVTNTLLSGNTSILTATKTITSTTFVTTGLQPSTLAANQTAHGTCHIIWEQNTAAATVSFGFGVTNSNLTALYITAPIGFATPFYQTQTTNAVTLINAAITPGASGTPYYLDLDFVLQDGASANNLTLYALTSNASDALAIEPGSSCGWLP